jgi:hypothetical protein
MIYDPVNILDRLENGNYLLTHHARIRAKERKVSARDIQALGRTGAVFFEVGSSKIRIKGSDFDGDPLAVLEFDY